MTKAKVKKVAVTDLPSGDSAYNDNRPTVFVNVRTSSYQDADDEYNSSNEPYSTRPDTYTTLDSIAVYTKKNSDYYGGSEMPVREPVEPGDVVYVVYVNYDTGDTFGHDSGQISLVGVEPSLARANELAGVISGHREYAYNGGNTLEYDGWAYYAGSWLGYFERLNDVEVYEVIVE